MNSIRDLDNARSTSCSDSTELSFGYSSPPGAPPPVTVIVPFSRPERCQAVLDGFLRQRYPYKDLLIVENGRALGCWTGSGHVLQAPNARSAGAAKNVALDFLRKELGEDSLFVSVFDDDDYYGPGYLEEQMLVLAGGEHDIVGKCQHFIVDDRGFWLLNRYVAHTKYAWCSGGVQSFDLAKVRRFREQPVAEDVHFVLEVESRGGHLYCTSPFHFLWERRGESHAYKRDAVARAQQWGLHVMYLGEEVDYDMVNGLKPIRGRRPPPP